LDTGEEVKVAVRKGKNRNINIAVSNLKAAREIASLAKPFTIFTPGLAGITKKEQHVSDGVLLRAIARGDANLVLRNTLLRLWENENRDLWNAFLIDLHTIFPSLDLEVSFERKTDEYITVTVTEHKNSVPLELCGTGVLQAIQILSYVHSYQPEVVVLDEPDSHLHPNNQRLLCELLFEVAEMRGIQVILSTHSRHVFDALRNRSSVLWVRDGVVDVSTDDDDLAILLELGALDIKELLKIEEGACFV
jgi:predicted ATPase